VEENLRLLRIQLSNKAKTTLARPVAVWKDMLGWRSEDKVKLNGGFIQYIFNYFLVLPRKLGKMNPFEREYHLLKLHFWGSMLIFRGVLTRNFHVT